ncbi:MAG: hypothetical protein M1401_12015 [Chloroflexi bacterium]|nr:hypothetical protein [Chloroflexota bacterium]
MGCLTAPFELLWRLLTGVVALTGRLLAVILGLALIVAGIVLTITIVGAVVGVPLIALGIALVVRGLF